MKSAKHSPGNFANAVTLPERASRYGDAALVTLRGCWGGGRVMPQAKSTEESKVIAAEARVFRQPLQLARIAAADDYIVGFQRRAELRHDFVDGAAPFLD